MLVRDAVTNAQQELAVATGEHDGSGGVNALLLTPDEAARRLSVGRTTHLCADGERRARVGHHRSLPTCSRELAASFRRPTRRQRFG
jgi:hypothetical protein